MNNFEHPFIQSVREQWLESPKQSRNDLAELVADHNSHERPDLKIPEAKDIGVLTNGYDRGPIGNYMLKVGIVNQGDFIATLHPEYSMSLQTSYDSMDESTGIGCKEIELDTLMLEARELRERRNSWPAKISLDHASNQFNDLVSRATEHLTEEQSMQYRYAVDGWISHYLSPTVLD